MQSIQIIWRPKGPKVSSHGHVGISRDIQETFCLYSVFTILHYIVLYCTALHPCIALHHCIALHLITLHRIVLYCIASHRIASHRIALHRIASHCIASLHCTAQHCIDGTSLNTWRYYTHIHRCNAETQ